MTSGTGMRLRSSREGVCGNNAVQFQSCDGSSYCTVLGKNWCTDSLRPTVIFQTMVRAIHWMSNQCPRSETAVADRPWWRQNSWKVWGKRFFRISASQFRNSLVDSPDFSSTAEWNRLSVAGKRFHNDAWWGTDGSDFMAPDIALDSYGTGIQTLVHRYDKCLNNGGIYCMLRISCESL